MKGLSLILVLLLSGCSYFQRHGFIKSGGATVAGLPDAGKPATLDTSAKGESLPLPAGSKVTVTKFEASLDLPAHDGLSAQKGEPAREVTEIVLAKDSVWQKQESSVKANTGTVDTSVRQHQQDLAASQPLLYASILAGVGAILCLYLKYPTPAAMCAGAAVVFLVAWKVSSAPTWLWVLGVVGLVSAAGLYFGHERGQKVTT